MAAFRQSSRRPGAIAIAALLLAAGPACAHTRIYSYVDAAGVRHFTDLPDDRRYRVFHLHLSGRTESGAAYDPALLARASRYDPVIERAAASASVEPALLRAVIVVESGFNSQAVSSKGAIGLMQLMPRTALRFGAIDPFDPRQNVHAGAHYLRYLLDRFGQNLRLALAAYDAGEDAVERNGWHVPPYEETQAYVPKVMNIYRLLSARSPLG
ncbi:MAG: lytic transglycosylase domain-containing protein [Gammaproteobacteria bacterium]|nr:lytic transglycosylase domain-containing protein [Gammaproteobacteria bacterium]